MRRYGWVFVLVFSIGVFAGVPAHADVDSLLMSPTQPSYPVSNYSWDANGWWDRFTGLSQMAGAIMLLNTFLLKFAIWVLNMGYAPTNWLAPFQAIAEMVHKSRFLDHVWPFFALVAGAVLIKDLAQHHMQRVMQRATLFVVALSAMLLFNAIGGSVTYIKMATDAIDGLCYGTSGWILTLDKPVDPTKTGTQQAIDSVNDEIWKNLITHPWEMGETGKLDATLGKDADQVRDIISNAGISFIGSIFDPGGTAQKAAQNAQAAAGIGPGTLWRDVLLKYPVNMDPRNSLAAILNNKDHPEAQQAFAPGYRFVLALLDFVAVLCAVVFILAAGVLLNLFYLMFLAAMLAGVVLLPVTLIPWGYSHGILRWWAKALAGSVVLRVGLSAYVGLTFFVERIITEGMSVSQGGYLASMILYPAVLALALLILSRIYKRMQPVRQVTGNVFSLPGGRRRADDGGAARGEGGEPAEGGNKKEQGAESVRTARRVDPDRGAGNSAEPVVTPIIVRRNPDGGTEEAPAEAQSRTGEKKKPARTASGNWSREFRKTLRRMGDELKEGDAAGAGYVLIRDTARGSAENAWKATKWSARTGWKVSKQGARAGWEGSKRFYKWLEQKIDDPPPPPPGGGGGGSNDDDNNDNNNGRDDSNNNRRRRIDPDRMDWAPETRDLNYWESVYRDDPRRPRQEPPEPRTEEDWQNLQRQDPAARSGDASPNPPGGGNAGQEPVNRQDSGTSSGQGRAESRPNRPGAPRVDAKRDHAPESEARPVNPDSGTQQPAAPGQEAPKNPERPSDWQRWAGQPERKDQEPKRTDAPAFRRPPEPENERVEENVQRTNPDNARVTETQGGPGPLPRSEAAAEPRAKQEPPRGQAPSRENAERREEVERTPDSSRSSTEGPIRVPETGKAENKTERPTPTPMGPKEARRARDEEDAGRPRSSLWARWAKMTSRGEGNDRPQDPDTPERPPEPPGRP